MTQKLIVSPTSIFIFWSNTPKKQPFKSHGELLHSQSSQDANIIFKVIPNFTKQIVPAGKLGDAAGEPGTGSNLHHVYY